ncbi:MAG TPA: hypothetical protein VKT49_09565 [Bryobacteraceae bacterium]|nr:hypothetical protein [Bryobacteraceae bacterium]
MIRVLPLAAAALLLTACGSSSKPAANETRQLPTADRTSIQTVPDHILGKPFLPGGTIAHYQKGSTAYDLFVAQFPTATDAAIALANLEGAIKGARLVRGLGGYFGSDAGRTIFVFPMDRWIGGVIGLPPPESEQAARVLIARFQP